MSSLVKMSMLAGALFGLVAFAGCGEENSTWKAPGVKYGTMIQFPTPWDTITANTNQNLTLQLTYAVTQKAYVDIEISEADSSVVSTSWQANPASYVIIAANENSTIVNIAATSVTAARPATVRFLLRDTPEYKDFKFTVKPLQ